MSSTAPCDCRFRHAGHARSLTYGTGDGSLSHYRHVIRCTLRLSFSARRSYAQPDAPTLLFRASWKGLLSDVSLRQGDGSFVSSLHAFLFFYSVLSSPSRQENRPPVPCKDFIVPGQVGRGTVPCPTWTDIAFCNHFGSSTSVFTLTVPRPILHQVDCAFLLFIFVVKKRS